MKIILISYLKLNELPPAISLLERINAIGGFYISLYDEQEYKYKFCNITFINVYDKTIEYNGSKSLQERIKYKISEFKQGGASRSIIRYIDACCDSNSLIWFLHESTVLSLGKRIEKYRHYFVSLYELDAAQRDKSGKLSEICQKAECVIVPEETRAHIIRAFLNLQKRPLVIHNKPSFDIKLINLKPDMKIAIDTINHLKAQGFFVLIYAGIFIPERQLNTIIEACGRLKKIKLVLIGRNSYYLEELKKAYENHFIYLGFFSPPDHLKIIESADAGILTYVARNGSINALFCAPNKIFEYGSFGLPIIGNDVPGLKQVIEKENIGACFNQDDLESIELAIKDVINNYNNYSDNIIKFVENVDVNSEIDEVLKIYKKYDEREYT